ncbi:MAG TPA: SAM-dependent methyltransferase [Streptosporangiaceae bacterium]|jgi:methyltransferase (TIGR00027 family)
MTDAQAGTPGLDPVAATARLTAAMRAVESARPDGLVTDPLAAALAGRPGYDLMDRMEMRESPIIAVRTRFFDGALAAACAAGPRQLVLIAAGMDTRAYRLGLVPGVTVYELDRPALLDLKNGLLAEAGARPRHPRRTVGADLAGDWTGALTAAGFRPGEPSCWLVEGMLQYLTEPDVNGLLDRITGLAAPGSRLLLDVVGQSFLDAPELRPMLDRFAAYDMAWTYGTEWPEGLLTPRGWRPEITRIGAVGTALGRWPFPDLERGTPGAPLGYFAHATR